MTVLTVSRTISCAVAGRISLTARASRCHPAKTAPP